MKKVKMSFSFELPDGQRESIDTEMTIELWQDLRAVGVTNPTREIVTGIMDQFNEKLEASLAAYSQL